MRKKQARDPGLAFLNEKGLKLKAKDIYYLVRNRSDKSGQELKFSNYSDFRSRLDAFSPYARSKMRTAIWSDRKFGQILALNQNGDDETRAAMRKIERGHAADAFSGKAELIVKSREEVGELEAKIETDFGIHAGLDSDSDDSGNHYALEKLAAVLPKLPKKEVRLKTFWPDTENKVSDQGDIRFNPDTPADELAAWLKSEGLRESEAVADINERANDARRNLEQLYRGKMDIYAHVFGRNYLKAIKNLETACRDLPLPENEITIRIKDPAEEVSRESLGLNWNLSSQEMRVRIEEYIKEKKNANQAA